MKKYSKIEIHFIEMILVEAFIAAMYLVGIVVPSFGWFLTQDVVLLTVIGWYIAYAIYKLINVQEEYLKEKSLHTTEGVE